MRWAARKATPASSNAGAEHELPVVDNDGAADRYFERLAALGELPGKDRAVRHAEADAIMRRKSRGVAGARWRARYAGAATTAIRTGPLTRTAIMSRSTRSPRRMPASKSPPTMFVRLGDVEISSTISGYAATQRARTSAITQLP